MHLATCDVSAQEQGASKALRPFSGARAVCKGGATCTCTGGCTLGARPQMHLGCRGSVARRARVLQLHGRGREGCCSPHTAASRPLTAPERRRSRHRRRRRRRSRSHGSSSASTRIIGSRCRLHAASWRGAQATQQCHACGLHHRPETLSHRRKTTACERAAPSANRAHAEGAGGRTR